MYESNNNIFYSTYENKIYTIKFVIMNYKEIRQNFFITINQIFLKRYKNLL